MTEGRAKLVDQTPSRASGTAKPPGNAAQPACNLGGDLAVCYRLGRFGGHLGEGRINY